VSLLADGADGGASENGTPTGKKARKSALARAAVSEPDAAALRARAQRFQREHALEAAKASGKGSLLSRTGGWAAADDDGADVVRRSEGWAAPVLTAVAEKLGPAHDRRDVAPGVQGLPPPHLRAASSPSPLPRADAGTQEPKPEQIRPLEVLQQTLAELKEKWRDFSTRADTQYNWICSQFKSLRQDLVVSVPAARARRGMTVHRSSGSRTRSPSRCTRSTRGSRSKWCGCRPRGVRGPGRLTGHMQGDDVEYNACLNKLQGLYDLGLEGQREEFTAYQILQLVRGLNHSRASVALLSAACPLTAAQSSTCMWRG
jgi:hypothetical protein